MKKITLFISLLLLSKFCFSQATWNGIVSSDWNDPNNWTWTVGSGIPTSTTNVSISFSAFNDPVLTNGIIANVNNLILDDGSLQCLNGSKINVYGNLSGGSGFGEITCIDDMTFMPLLNTEISFLGSAQQSITDVGVTIGKARINNQNVLFNTESGLMVADSLIFTGNPVALGSPSVGNIIVNDGILALMSTAKIKMSQFTNAQIPPHIISNQALDFNNNFTFCGYFNFFATNPGINGTVFFPVGATAFRYTPVEVTQTGAVTDAWNVYIDTVMPAKCPNDAINLSSAVKGIINVQPIDFDNEEILETASSPANIKISFNENNVGHDVPVGFTAGSTMSLFRRSNQNCYQAVTGITQSGSPGMITVSKTGQQQFWKFALAAQSNVTIESIDVTTIGGVPSVINTSAGTLPLKATITPSSISQAVTWSIVPVTGTATISSAGVVTAQGNGIVWAKAVSTVNPSFKDSLSITITNQGTAVTNAFLEQGYELYPNPTTGFATLKSLNNHPQIQLTIFDLYGRSILRENIKENGLKQGYRIDLSSFAAGIYSINLKGPGITLTNKLIRK